MSDKQACKNVFDADYYAKNNADVVCAVGNSYDALLNHYMEHGIYEGRSASSSFNATVYKSRYSDLAAAYGNNWFDYVRHYLTSGKSEGRDASSDKAQVSPQNGLATVQTGAYTFLGSYSTKYDPKISRATNVNLAASRINGMVINPGAEFSFSNSILPRTPENGYVEATVFINKEKAKGIGGGICQVSSTLYACMKTIGLPATERHPHSLPVSYIAEGWDATIAAPSLDLRFVNVYDKPIMITASADNGLLTVSLWKKNK